MKWKIKVSYQTGDSFSTYDEVGYVGHVWGNIESAQKTMEYMKEHYDTTLTISGPFKMIKRRLKSKPWFYPKDWEWESTFYGVDDDGNKVKLGAFWQGYFERPHSFEIVCEDMRIDL